MELDSCNSSYGDLIGVVMVFFVGIFGIQNKSKVIRTESSVVCPVCGVYGRYDIIKTYSYFHVFFLPVWQWNKKYYIQTRCCQTVCELDQEIGSRIEAGESVEIESEHVHCSGTHSADVCPNCGASIDPAYRYCPYCGKEI